MAETPRVLLDIDGPVARVQLNRPDKLNGVDFAMLSELVQTAERLRADRSVRVVLLEGSGDSFCAGLDFPSAAKEPKSRIARYFVAPPWRRTNLFQQALWTWRELPVPVIAICRGHVFGAGIQLALAADFRFTTPDCQWSILEAKWGLVPDMSGTVPLVELVGADVAKRLVMTGEIITGHEAAEIGLATAASDDPAKDAAQLAEAITARSPDSVAAAKKLLNLVRWGGIGAAFRRERLYQLRMFLSANTAKARKAGATGEPARFSDRTFG